MALLLVGAAFCQEAVPSEQSTLHPDDNLIATSTVASNNKAVNQGDEPTVLLPAPVDVSFAVGVKEQGDGEGVIPRVEIDTDGVPIVHGVVLPDDPNDTKTWRNARVLNNVLLDKQQQQQRNDNNSAIQEQQDMFIYRPASSVRILNDDFQPSQADTSSFSPSLPYPAYYYQRFYQDKSSAQPQLPDSLAVETDEEDSSSNPSEAVESVSEVDPNVDGRGFNIKKKNSGIVKAKPGSSYGSGARPITYYVKAEEAKEIHDDRSPYEYEPAQHQTSYYTSDYSTQESVSKQDEQEQLQLAQSQQQYQQETNPQRTGYYQQNGFVPGNVVPAPQDSFVIRDQTYTSGGQTFSVPIPVPKDQYVQQYGQQYAPQQQYASQQQPQYAYNFQQYPPQFSQQYYKQQQQTQQPLDFLGAKFKEQVQKAKDKLHGITDPVVDPLMEAGQKISTNLGLPDRVNQINQKVATPGILVPLAMVGGAALALGGLGTAIHLSNPDTKNNVFKTLKIDNSTLAERITTALHPFRNTSRVARSADDEDEGYPAASEFVDDEKENLLNHVLSALNGPQKSFLAQMQQTGFDEWQKTPCAKRIFCDVMIQQNDDAINLMEKRMSTFLSLLDSGVARNLQALTSDVMDGIRRRNCRAFVCGSAQPHAQQQ
ncbi:hypothetical protein DAPPUDRAFT_323345 [Daphnia pulex]|uniref:Uncharacterized protein n=1 Tax=Daphnia pulex TaxID=6669 RepID=E9GYM0_DAPPU|nr:hypothetical protein DAPPUDRAFT_323345 [Daphnia pulex]|eukprot:EFX75462.1 hypothetical protein DAPPUDRAFT_323345 [Daphnia pulex]